MHIATYRGVAVHMERSDMNNITDDPFVTRKQARQSYFAGVARSTLSRWEAEGKLPPVVRISRRVQGWRKSALEQFLLEREGATK